MQKDMKQYLENDIFQDYRNVHKKYIKISLNECLGLVGISYDKIIPFHCGKNRVLIFQQLLDRALDSSLSENELKSK